MNIDDFTNVDAPIDGRYVAAIFEKQYDLYLRYYDIERNNGFFKPHFRRGEIRPHLDDPQLQTWIKNMFWRVTEEIAEAIEPMEEFDAVPADWKDQWKGSVPLRHFFEELADAVHFLAEVSLIVGIDPDVVQDAWAHEWKEVQAEVPNCAIGMTSVEVMLMQVIKAMGLAANCLKNKPWKCSHMPTDVQKFGNLVYASWQALAIAMSFMNCSPADVYELYFKKHKVNKFRQETNY